MLLQQQKTNKDRFRTKQPPETLHSSDIGGQEESMLTPEKQEDDEVILK